MFIFVVYRPEISPGGTSTGTPVSSVSPEITPSSTPGRGDAAPNVPLGRALAFQALLARRLDLLYYDFVRNIVYNVIVNHFRQQQPATSPNIGAAPQMFGERGAVAEGPVVGVSPPVPVAMGRGMIARLKSMALNVPTTRLPESEALAPQAEARPMEFKPLLEQQEKPPLVKKGTLGSRLVLKIYFSLHILY